MKTRNRRNSLPHNVKPSRGDARPGRRVAKALASTAMALSIGVWTCMPVTLAAEPLSPASGLPLTVQGQVAPVSNDVDLRAAIAAGGQVTIDLQGDIQLASPTVAIPAGTDVTVTSSLGTAPTITGPSPAIVFFTVEEGGSLTLGENIVLNGGGKHRFIYCQGNLSIAGADMVKGRSSSSSQGVITVTGPQASLDFSDGKLVGGGEEIESNGPILYVSNRATGVMSGGTVSNWYTTHGGSVYIYNADFEITGTALVTNNKTKSGNPDHSGGVAVRSTTNGGATLVMNGGTISNNGSTEENYYPGGGVVVSGSYSTSNPSSIAPAVFTMNAGTISGNKTYYEGGGVLSYSNARFVMNGGTISGNYATMGGGVSADNAFYQYAGLVPSYESKGWTAERWAAVSPGTFVMNGGTISNNYAGSYSTPNPGGGGVYSLSSDVHLKGGNIINNTSNWVGGGAYISIYPYSINIYDATITKNTAAGIGGGIWLCPTGDIEIMLTDAVANYGNTAYYTGDDFAVYHASDWYVHTSVITERMLGGGPSNWYYDGTPYAYDRGSGTRYPDSSPYAQNWNGMSSIGLKAIPNSESIELAASRSKLTISGNWAHSGGGVGSNGHLYMGVNESKTVKITKYWEAPEGSAVPLPDSVTVAIEITGDNGVVYTVEHIELNAANDWTATIDDLPHHAKVNIVEDEDGSAGWVRYYTDSGEIDDTPTTTHEDFTVTNARAGKLKLSKEVKGDAGDKGQEFHYTVSITDDAGNPFIGRDAEGANAEFTYTYTGGAAGGTSGTMKSGDTLALRHGEEVVIDGIPHGARYTVHEAARDALGYEIEPRRVNDGAVGEAAETGTIEGDAVTELEYVNEKWKDMGALEISKALAGDAAETDREFEFICKFLHEDGTELAEGLFAYTGSREGEVASGGTVALKGGEKVVIEGIPEGTRYRVSEVGGSAAGYEIHPVQGTVAGPKAEEGTIDPSGTDSISYTNERNRSMGALMVSKSVEGDAADESKEFTFIVDLLDESGAELTGVEFPFTGSEEGIISSGGTFSLRHGETVTVSGLPEGTRWSVRESPTDVHGYEIVPVQGELTGPDAEAGTIAAGETSALAYTNKKFKTMGGFTLSKTVEGEKTDRAFDFRVTLSDESGDELTGVEFAYTGSREGLVSSGGTIALKGGETIELTGLPAGTSYRVEEVGAEGYVAKAEGAEGTVEAGSVGTVSFVNEPVPAKPGGGVHTPEKTSVAAASKGTGGGASHAKTSDVSAKVLMAAAMLLLTSGAALAALCIRRRRLRQC